jgi:hypothetical protein
MRLQNCAGSVANPRKRTPSYAPMESAHAGIAMTANQYANLKYVENARSESFRINLKK